MKRIKVHGRKIWNNGWPNRVGHIKRALNRYIERKFRQTESADIAEQLEEAS
jgi:hypothetical protein